jgi:hypothetical protein
MYLGRINSLRNFKDAETTALSSNLFSSLGLSNSTECYTMLRRAVAERMLAA